MANLQTFESDLSHFDPNNPYVGDEKLPVQFYMGAIQDDNKSTEAGRPIYNDVECIKIFNSKDNIIDRPVRDTDKQRWPRQYQAWKQSGVSEPGAAGTKLEHWPQISRAQAEEFRYFKIFTVEQLAEIPDSTLQGIMGAQQLKTLAKAYVEAAKGGAPLLRMQKEMESKDLRITELEADVKRMMKMLKKAGIATEE